jgi:hypothetical protein
MVDFVKKYAKNVHSQNGEDGIIAEVLNRIKLKKGIAVEFGGADGVWCSNTAHLRDQGWKVFMYDRSANQYVESKMITCENVNDLPDADVMSIDIDGNDYWIWQAYDKEPEIVIIEINSSIKPEVNHVSEEKGASYSAMVLLGMSKGYFLLCHTGNLVFVKEEYKELFPEIAADPITEPYAYFKTDWL